MYSLIMAMGTAATTSSTTGSTQGSMFTTLITFGVIILIFYFLIIRPQKRDKEAKDMLASMKKGDKIVTIGGIRGTVAVVKESTVIVKVDDNARIEFSKNAISQILDKKPETAASSKKEKADKVEKVEKVEKPAEVEAPKAEAAPEAVATESNEPQEKKD